MRDDHSFVGVVVIGVVVDVGFNFEDCVDFAYFSIMLFIRLSLFIIAKIMFIKILKSDRILFRNLLLNNIRHILWRLEFSCFDALNTLLTELLHCLTQRDSFFMSEVLQVLRLSLDILLLDCLPVLIFLLLFFILLFYFQSFFNVVNSLLIKIWTVQ